MADLEQRVKRLEGELRILKNQIQMTLLDIQAELAAHYYPELRTELESIPQAPRAVSGTKAIDSRAKSQAASTPYENNDTQEPDDAEPILLKKVSLDQIHQQPPRPHASLKDDPDELEIVDQMVAVAYPDLDDAEPLLTERENNLCAEPLNNPIIQASVIRWTGDTVTVLGKEQTRKIIELCILDGRIDKKWAERLKRLLDLGAEYEPEETPSFDAVLNAMVELVEILDAH